jgi:hypothetical protein
MNGTQQKALKRCRKSQSESGSPLQKLGWKDGPKALAHARVLYILEMLNDLFFFGAVRLSVARRALGDSRIGQCHPMGLVELPCTKTFH